MLHMGVSWDAEHNGEGTKKSSLPVSVAKQEMTVFSCLLLIDPCRFHRKGVSPDVELYD